jgi:hydroxypyruvate isomerase
LFTAPVGDFVQGGEGLAAVPGRQARFRDSIAEAREYADALQSRYVQVLAGRGPDDTAGRQRYLDTLLDNLRFACEAFADSDTRVVLEPINTRDFPGYLLSTPAQARELLAALRATRPMLVLDTLHLAVMGVDPAEEIREYAADYAHLQWADAPGRSAPGTGDLDFTALAAAMREAGYRGWVGAEYRPAPGDPDWAAQLRGAWRPG